MSNLKNLIINLNKPKVKSYKLFLKLGYLAFIDSPKYEDDYSELLVKKTRGWVLTKDPVKNIAFILKDKKIEIELGRREDVVKIYGNLGTVTGLTAKQTLFEIYVKYGTLPKDIEIKTEKRVIKVNLFEDLESIENFFGSYLDSKKIKLDKIRSLLFCAGCGGELLFSTKEMKCKKCNNIYIQERLRYDFLTSEFKKQFQIKDTEEVSAWGYDGIINQELAKHPNKLYLDVGAGYRKQYLDNVVNYEIVPYPSTDVLGVGEKLPFKDGCFEGVFCVAVLEHVYDPFKVAREIERVTKKGGFIFSSVPFLQPVHAFPNHYYNMTLEGHLRCYQQTKIEQSGVLFSGHPIHSLIWFLNSYTQGLPENDRQEFLDMTLEEVIKLGENQEELRKFDWVNHLTIEKQHELACGTYLVGKKI